MNESGYTSDRNDTSNHPHIPYPIPYTLPSTNKSALEGLAQMPARVKIAATTD